MLRKPNTRLTVSDCLLKGNEERYVLDALRSNWISMGKYVSMLERMFAEQMGVAHAVAVSSGTAALHLALLASGVGPHDKVIVPTLTFVASSNAIRYTGAMPEFVDADPTTWNLDLDEVRAIARSGKAKAIMPVHLYGMPVDMSAVMHIAEEYGLMVIEDSAESIGGVWREIPTGAWGHVGCYSFYANKTITTGEGGMVVTNDPALADRVRLLRGHAQQYKRYYHTQVGYNYRMTDIQAAVGCAQMEQLDRFISMRTRVMIAYRKHLKPPARIQGEGYKYPGIHSAWAVAVRIPPNVDRDQVMEVMAREGVETRPVFYPNHILPIYNMPSGAYPMASAIAESGIVLPMSPTLHEEDVMYTCYVLDKAIQEVSGVE